VAVLAVLAPAALGVGAAATTVSETALRACAGIDSDADRLACYDHLAGRSVSRAAETVPGHSAAAASAPPAPTPPSAHTFGLYAAEHPKPPPAAAAATLEGRVVSVGSSAGGHMTVLLEGGALWELDDADPLLAAGETVTITRAVLGSYILRTPSHRSHRARRLH
jgi:phospholipase A1